MGDKIFVVVVTYNGQKWIKQCLESVKKIDVPFEVVIVDNLSSDQTIRIIKEDFPEYTLLALDSNLGFGKANNLGIQKALDSGATYIFLLNQDAYFFEGSLQKVLNGTARIENLGIISPIHFANEDGVLDFQFKNYVQDYFGSDFLIDFEKKELKNFYHSQFINAAAWLIPSAVIRKVGLFHPVFDHYGEDEEYVNRIKHQGLQVYISSEFSIIHDRPQSRGQSIFFLPQKILTRKLLIDKLKGKKNGAIKVFIQYLRLALKSIKRKDSSNFADCIKEYFNFLKKKRSLG
ncbi:Glycosyltransferase, GT2 family [Aquiflexum balticum DSM 16537]|uniref:Glycosyltransferase, GT2 family n=1 Tax=Aquiflexum balticum DSM 16537 TaxID=758820 RepID=A0A1W2HB10_9BACT|nr:glycosyltransferase family 2 protein [Aquiflexum balticum]SMD46057.1 Glycosyltransferase, GT2 family [Aquiflexum balticum DSM 16537]